MNLHMISPDGHYSVKKIGSNIDQGEVPQFTVPGGFWFASEVTENGTYCLMGCTVSPGFDFDDFEMPERDYLWSAFPQHKTIISKLTRDQNE